MQYGVSYYPEHKNEQELAHDLQLIIDSGINTVRMGEFAWCRMEPREGEFDFIWLEQAVEHLGKAGVRTVICTPTACPPAWVVERHPEMMYVDNRGVRRPFGGRRHYCYNSEAYRAHCVRITKAIAERFGKNPYVAGFQIDNEPAQEGTGRCCCPACTEKFRAWLKERFHTVEELNHRIGSIFWSMDYTSFAQLTPPVNSIEVGAQQSILAFYENPTLRLEFERFASESQISFQNLQTDILKAHTLYPVTTNATGLATNSIDNFKSTQALDCYAFDYYPGLRDARVDSFPYAFARGVKHGRPFWVLEFMSGGGHRLSGSGRLQPNPGALKQAVVQSFAHGADMMLHFQFRTFPFGAEQLNYAIVDMDGKPRRRYAEMKETAALLRKLEPLEAAAFPREVAVCVDYDTHWALRIKPANDPEFKYLDYCGRMHRNLSQAGVTADVVSPQADWSGYKVICLPAMFLVPEALREKLRAFVQNGGTLVSGFLTAVKNEDNVGDTRPLPAGLTDVFGVEVQEVEPVFAQNRSELALQASGARILTPDGMWSELLEGSAEARGVYLHDYKKDACAVSRSTFGKGTAWYFGTDVSDEAWQTVLAELCDDAGVRRCPVRGVAQAEVVERVLNGKHCCFVFNFAKSELSVPLCEPMRDYLTGELCEGAVTIARSGFAVLVEA